MQGKQIATNPDRRIIQCIKYDPSLIITNLEQLPRGSGARFLEVIESHDKKSFVAVSNRRKIPKKLKTGSLIIEF